MSNDSKHKPECQTTKTFTVYVIRCKVTNMTYVGITGQQVEQRIRQHKKGKQQLIDREIHRLGRENFDWFVAEENIPVNLISEREQYFINVFGSVYPNGYNKTSGGLGNFKHSEKTCEQISKSHRGKKRAPFTAEHRANISRSRIGENNPNYGRPAWNKGVPCTEETKDKIRQTLTGRKRPDQSERMKGENNPNFGKPIPAETRDKLRQRALERDVIGEKNPHYGKHHTEETKAKLREKALARYAAKRAAKAAQETQETP